MWIAVCDDDENFIKRIMKLLSGIIYGDDQLTFYMSGFELIEAAKNSGYPIDLLLLDIEMPGLNGIESARELREICPDIIIYVLTNFIRYAFECYGINASDYIIKPVKAGDIERRINRARSLVERTMKSFLRIKTIMSIPADTFS